MNENGICIFAKGRQDTIRKNKERRGENDVRGRRQVWRKWVLVKGSFSKG